MDSAPEGYPKLATYLSSDRNFMQYRGFSYLHARLLLALQCDIEGLERELDDLDARDMEGNQDRLRSKRRDDIEARKMEDAKDDDERSRPAILADLKQQLMDYGMPPKVDCIRLPLCSPCDRPRFAQSEGDECDSASCRK